MPDEPITVVEKLPNGNVMFQDPLSQFIMLPFMPFIILMQFQTQLMQMNQQPQKTKITTITRSDNSMDIIEKWI